MKLRERKGKPRKGKRGKISYFADWQESGKRRRHTFKNLDKKLAELAFGKFKLELAQGRLAIPTQPNLTITDCLETYLDSKRTNCVTSYLSTLEGRIRQIIEHFGASASIQSLTEQRIRKFITAMKASGLAPPTVNRKIEILQAAIKKAVKAGLIAKNPVSDIQKQSDPREPVIRYLEHEEIDRLLDVCENGSVISIARRNGRDYEVKVAAPQGLYPLVMFLLHTGARLGEALALRWQDVNFKTGRFGQVRLLTTKRAARGRTAKPRFVQLSETLRDFLQSLERNGDKVLPRVSNVRRKFNRAIEIAGLNHCRIHDLRHTFASHLAMNGTPLLAIRDMLGHSTLTMTLRYAHLAPEVTADAVQSLSFGSKKQVAKVVRLGQKEQ